MNQGLDIFIGFVRGIAVVTFCYLFWEIVKVFNGNPNRVIKEDDYIDDISTTRKIFCSQDGYAEIIFPEDIKTNIQGNHYIAEKINVKIGRAKDNDIIINNQKISKYHCVIEFVNKTSIIRDKSTNGTFINGERICNEKLLPEECDIRVAEINFKFRRLLSTIAN